MLKKFIIVILSLLFFKQSLAIDLFGYKLHDDIHKYKDDGKVLYDKEYIDSITLFEDKVLITNKYLNKYLIRSTKAGNIYEIYGTNTQLKITPVECLNIQTKFINSFEKKNSNLYLTDIKKLPVTLNSKVTWDVHLRDMKKNNNLIFSVTCDYSFNNRRMDITLSDKNYLNEENTIFEDLQKTKQHKVSKSKIDTSGI